MTQFPYISTRLAGRARSRPIYQAMRPSDFNPVGFMYLNPEYVISLEEALETYERHATKEKPLHYNLSGLIPDNFDAQAFLSCHRGALNISPLNKLIGMTECIGTRREADTVMEDATCTMMAANNAATFNFLDPNFTFDANLLSVGDELVIEVPGLGRLEAIVTSTAGNREFNATFRVAPHGGNGVVLVRGHVLYDLERLARINVVRGHGRAQHLDGEFNADLYRLLYPDARCIHSDVGIYHDYTRRWNAGEFRVARADQLCTPSGDGAGSGALAWTSNAVASCMRQAVWCSNAVRAVEERGNHVIEAPLPKTMVITQKLVVSPLTTDGVAVDVKGSVRAHDYLVTSDARLKKDVGALCPRQCASLFSNISPVRFEYILPFKEENTHYGFLAQELMKCDPNLVCTEPGALPTIMKDVKIGKFGEVELPDHGLCVGDRLRVCLREPDKQADVVVRQVLDKDRLVINDLSLSGAVVKVYGTHAVDIMQVNQGNVVAMMAGAIKDVLRRLDAIERHLPGLGLA